MQLAHALRLGHIPRLALVGAGGKTSVLFCLAREMKTALLTATTHLATSQLELADRHFYVEKPADVEALSTNLPEGVLLLTGPRSEAERTAGLDSASLERLLALANDRQLPLLVEADGSRRRPLKAPAEHEPVIPAWVDTVLVVAGLSGLGQPLTPEWVHRPERFAELSGLAPGAPVTPEALAIILVHPAGGLKGIPPEARRVAFLNQADTPEHQGQAHRLATQLLGAYQAVIVAAVAPLEAHPLEACRDPVFAVHEPVAGIILAAGASQRMGRPKQILPWRNEPLVRHVARTALQAGLSPVVVVTGYAAAEVQAAVRDLPVNLVHNSDWQGGQSTSVMAGLHALPPENGAGIFLLADQPQVPAGLLRSLVELHAQTLSPLVAPLVEGRRANPVLFDCSTFPELLALTGDMGGRVLFARHPVTWLPWQDPSLALDVDTPEDYQRLLES